MFGTHDLALFILSGFLLNLTPGADCLFIALRSAAQGFRAGLAATLGVCSGCLVHVLAAALGLSAILASSAMAFTIVKLAGAAYLIYLGLGLLFGRSQSVTTAAPAAAAASSVFRQGFLTNVLNPKMALFFLAFVPQFINPAASSKPIAFLFLGMVFTLNSLLYCIALAWLSSRAASLGISRRAGLWASRLTGGLFVALGLRLALSK